MELIKFNLFGLIIILKQYLNAKMGLNLSRGDAIKYYSSDRITQIIGNGLVCLIDEKTNIQ